MTNTTPASIGADALREALLVARDHIDMDALRISHGKDAALISGALASAAQPAAVPHAQMTEEIDSILSDPDTRLSPGAERALRWLRTWTDAPLVGAAAAPKAAPAALDNPVVGCHECHITHDLGACATAAPIPAITYAPPSPTLGVAPSGPGTSAALAAAPKASPAAQGDALDATYRERWDAELGRTAMRFVDRAGDVHPGVDDAEAICAEFHAAMSAVIERMPHVQRMNAANEDASAAARAAKEGAPDAPR